MPLQASAAQAQRLDSIVRTVTASGLAFMLVGACIYTVASNPDSPLGATGAALFALASSAVGFFFGGHVATNTAALEEARQVRATESAEASAQRAEKAAPLVVSRPPGARRATDPPLEPAAEAGVDDPTVASSPGAWP